MPDPEVSILIKAVDQASAAFKYVKNNILGIDSATTKMAKSLATGFLAFKGIQAVTSFFKESFQAATEFEYEIARVNTIFKDGGPTIEQFSSELRTMAKEMPVESAKELATGLYEVTSACIDSAHAMDVLKVSAKAAIAGVTSTATAVDVITTILNSYHLEAEKAAWVSDILFKTIDRGKTTMQELGTEVGNVAAVAYQLNIDFEDVGAAMSLLTRGGIQTAEATTQLVAVMNAFIKPTERMNELAKQYGYITPQNLIETMGFADALAIVNKEVESGNYQIGELVPNIRALKGYYILASDGAKIYTDEQKEFLDVFGTTERAYKIMADTTTSKTDIMKNQWEDLGITFAEKVSVPIVGGIYEITQGMDTWGKGIDQITQKYNDMSKENKDIVKALLNYGILGVNITKVNENYSKTIETIVEETENYNDIMGRTTGGFVSLYDEGVKVAEMLKKKPELLADVASSQMILNDAVDEYNDLLKDVPKLQRDIVESDRDVEQSALGVLVAREKLVDQLREIENRPRTLEGEKRKLGELERGKEEDLKRIEELKEQMKEYPQAYHRAIGYAPDYDEEVFKKLPEGIKFYEEWGKIEKEIADLERGMLDTDDDIFYQKQRILETQESIENSARDTSILNKDFLDDISGYQSTVENLKTLKEKELEIAKELHRLENDIITATATNDIKKKLIDDWEAHSLAAINRVNSAQYGTSYYEGQITKRSGGTSNYPTTEVNVFVDGEQIAARVDKKYIEGMYPGMEW